MFRTLHIVGLAGLLLAACDSGIDDVETDQSWTDGKADAPSGPLKITEVLAFPEFEQAQFVEVLNISDEKLDVTGFTISIGTTKSELVAVSGRSSELEPGQLAIIMDPDADPELLGLADDVPVVTTEHELDKALTSSQKLIVRTREGATSDRANATTEREWIALERTLDNTFTPSAYGTSPGERNFVRGNAIEVFFASPPVHATDLIQPELVKIINGADKTLDAAFYQVESVALIDALIAAKKRGVTVRIVTDTEYFEHADYQAGFAKLASAGIKVVHDMRGARMHTKFLVVDGRAVFAGSYNLLDTHGTFDHADNAVYIRSEQLAAIHTAEFEEMFAGNFGKSKTDTAQHRVYVDGAPIDVYFSPTDATKEAVLEAVSAAQSSVHFASFSFYHAELAEALIARHSAKADVRGFFDATSTGATTSYPLFVSAGVDVRRVDAAVSPFVFFHNKYFVVDYGLPNATVLTGSTNFSNSAYEENDESTYKIRDREIAARYYATYRTYYDPGIGPNEPTTAPPAVVISEVLSAESSTAERGAYVELANMGTTSVDLGSLKLQARGGVRVPAGTTSLAAGKRVIVEAGENLRITNGTPLVLWKGTQVVSTFEAVQFPGAGKSLARQNMTAEDRLATWASAAPSPAQ